MSLRLLSWHELHLRDRRRLLLLMGTDWWHISLQQEVSRELLSLVDFFGNLNSSVRNVTALEKSKLISENEIRRSILFILTERFVFSRIAKKGCVRAADFFPPEFLRWCRNDGVNCCESDRCNSGKTQDESVVENGDDGTRKNSFFKSKSCDNCLCH